MSVTGTGSLSLRKIDLEGSKPIAIAFKKLVFAHQATAGETGITLTALSTPSQMSSTGFVQPTAAELASAQILYFRKNLKIISSVRGELMDYLSYSCASNSRINFVGFTALANEIFIGIIDHSPSTGLQVVDAAPLVSTGTLTAGTQDFNTGSAFEVNKYPTQQIGNVIVYVDGVQQFRNSGNAVASPSADGNYQEIDNGSGLGAIIRFNTTEVYDRSILVVSNGLLVNRPSDSRDQALESLAGQVDKIVPVLAAAAGVSTTTFQASPNNVDIKTFGDNVQRLQRYRLITSATTAVGPVDLVMINTSSGGVTLTLPASPNVGDWIEAWDSHGTWGSFGVTLGRNGNLIEGDAADFTINTSNVRLKLVYAGSARGWLVGDLT
jgi:hypothetical protein